MTVLMGMTYPTVTGENSPKGASFTRILGEFPEMQLWSEYYNGSDIPNWQAEWFAVQYNGIVYYLVSIKSSNLAAIATAIQNMPEHLRGRIILILHHEPDQWRSPSDDRGDPDPETWWQRQVDFLDLAEGTEWRNWFYFAVCFTEDRARTDAALWEANWGYRVPTEPRIDFVLWDCFNIGRSIVRTGSDIFGIPIAYGERCQNAWNRSTPVIMIREYGQVTPVDSPEDSTAVANAVAENIEYANQRDDVIAGIVWYYNHNNTLADLATIRRPLTMAVLQIAVNESAQEQPDPGHPQYQFGYGAGRESCEDEIAALEQQLSDAQAANIALSNENSVLTADLAAAQSQVAALTANVSTLSSQVATLQQQVSDLQDQIDSCQSQIDAAHAAGRTQAFTEVRDWANSQIGN